MPPASGIASERRRGVSQNKTRITIAFASSAAGAKQPMFILVHARRPRCFQKKDGDHYGFYYRFNKKAWMTGELFIEWILLWDAELRKEGRHILLLLDNFSGHSRIVAGLSNIKFEFLTPNMTSHIQPLEQGLIRSFKAHYRHYYIRHALNQAWDDVAQSTLINCFRHAGVLSERDSTGTIIGPIPNLTEPLQDEASQDAFYRLEDYCDHMVQADIMPASNRMTLDFLCNLTDEIPPDRFTSLRW
ncbi:hypothetical protein JCM5296_000210 [Sporobolomyces johnsonii]